MQSNCSPYKTEVSVTSPTGIYMPDTDPYFWNVISSFTVPTGGNGGTARKMDFTFKPSVLLFGDGLSTTTASVTVKVVWWTPGTVVDTTFSLVIYPTSKIVSWEYARTDSQPTVTKAGAVTNKTYLVGDPAVTITPPTFTAVATADNSSWGNTLIPV